MDAERADRLEPEVQRLRREAGTTGVLVMEAHEGKGQWKGMEIWNDLLSLYSGPLDSITFDPTVTPEDNASILFTSGGVSEPLDCGLPT